MYKVIHLLINLAVVKLSRLSFSKPTATIGPPETDCDMKHVNTLSPSYILFNLSFYYSKQNILSLERGITHKETSLKELET